jgi:hypothetical protein
MSDHDVLRDRLDALSRRIEARTRELTERGELTANVRTDFDGFHRRSTCINQKISDAISKGETLGIIRHELERDFSSLSEDFDEFEERIDEEFEERLDAEEMRRRGST